MTGQPDHVPIAYTVHDGSGIPPTWRRTLIAEWLTEHGVDPSRVAANHPILILTVPYRPDVDPEGPWLIQVIVFTEYYVGPQGTREQNYLTREPVTYQRTVPLRVPFPTGSPDDEGTHDGEADRQAAEEAPEEQVRPAGSAPVPHRFEGKGSQCSREGVAERIEGDPEDHPREGHQAVAQPEEDRQGPQEEVGDA